MTDLNLPKKTNEMIDNSELTKNQKVVLSALTNSEKPLSAYEILEFNHVRDKGIKAPLTVYRALEKLITFGLVHRIESLNAFIACDSAPHIEPAGFIICNNCKNTTELRINDCEDHLTRGAREIDFHVEKVRVEVTGQCDSCRKSA